MGLPEKIQAIEEEMKRTQINKHTEHHVGLLKAKLAKLRAEQERSQGSKQGGAGFELKPVRVFGRALQLAFNARASVQQAGRFAA